MSNTLKISLTFFFIFLIYFPTKSNHINKEHSIYIQENTTEFEIIKSSIETDEYEPTTKIFNFSFKAKRNGIWLPCEYNFDFIYEPKRSNFGFIISRKCQGSNELPPLEEIETDLRPEENRKIGRIIAQKIKEKGFPLVSKEVLQRINLDKKYVGCHVNIFYSIK